MIEFTQDDIFASDLDQGEENGGEALSPSVEEMAPEMFTPRRRKENIRAKPPNILLYCGKKDSERLFNVAKSAFEQCINRDKYIIYHLKHDQVQTTPWADHTACLLICSEKVYDGLDRVFLDYFLQGGTLMSFNSAFDTQLVARDLLAKPLGVLLLTYQNRWENISVICGKSVYRNSDMLIADVTAKVIGREKINRNPVLLEAEHEPSGGVAILSQVKTSVSLYFYL